MRRVLEDAVLRVRGVLEDTVLIPERVVEREDVALKQRREVGRERGDMTQIETRGEREHEDVLETATNTIERGGPVTEREETAIVDEREPPNLPIQPQMLRD